ncbi:MAG: cyclic pyranopterin monophosphate synthase MoaC [Firmicutes bacterium]|nr:cyclic pyranopterin monophosphate synthase MoaC [Bacillota bacterium]
MEKLTHIDDKGRASMVDITGKVPQHRRAVAEGFITLEPQTLELIGKSLMKKGDVLAAAEIAGVMAAKKTSDIIPLCHPLLLNHIEVRAKCEDSGIRVVSSVICDGKTGVEMEALTAASAALLTVYDMCKAVDKKMVIDGIRLLEKTKSESGIKNNEN